MIAMKAIKFAKLRPSSNDLRNIHVHIILNNMSMPFVIHQKPSWTKFRPELDGKSTIN